MFTGDNDTFAKMVASNTGIDEYKQLLPDEKFTFLTNLQKDHHVILLAMVSMILQA